MYVEWNYDAIINIGSTHLPASMQYNFISCLPPEYWPSDVIDANFHGLPLMEAKRRSLGSPGNFPLI